MEDNLSPQQSLRLIQSMISKARSSLGESRFYFLLWGWIAFTAILAQFLLKVVFDYRHYYIVWLVAFGGIAATVVHGRRHSKKQRTRSYIGDSMAYLWTGIGISFFILSFIISFLPVTSPSPWFHGYPFFILLYGLGTFVSGKILEFRPLVIGGIINWALACGAVFVHFDYQMLFAAAAILCSYLIPGYLLRQRVN